MKNQSEPNLKLQEPSYTKKHNRVKKLVIYIIPIFLALYLYTPCYSQKPDHKYRATVHKFNEVWNTGRYDLFDEVVHPSYKKLEGDLILDGVESLKKICSGL